MFLFRNCNGKTLSVDVQDYYLHTYKDLMASGAVGLVSKLTHFTLETWPWTHLGIRKNHFKNVLEVGAGHSQHLRNSRIHFSNYVESDVAPTLLSKVDDLLVKGYQEVPTRKLGEELKELFTEGQLFRLYENKLKNAKLAQDLRSVDLQSLPYPDESFDLLLSTCVLIHCEKPDLAIDSILRVTKKGSRSVIYVPNEGSPILVLAQKLFTRPKQRRAGFDGEIIHYSEHRFQYKYLLSLLKKKNVKFSTRYFPFVFLPWWFNLWTIVTVQKD